MMRFMILNSSALGLQFSSRVLRNYAEAWKRTGDRAARFSDRALRNYAVSAHLSETLAVIKAQGDAPAEILLYDEIGFWGVTAKDFVQALAAAGDGPLTLRINSPGGDVFDGLAIYNALRARSAPITVVVDGLAASAASFIAMAGKTVTMAEQSMLMIHNAWGICMGDRNDMLDMSAVMEKIDAQLGDIYAGKSGKAAADIRAMMDAETWLTSTEAKDAGLCDVIAVPAQPDAKALAAAVRIGAKPVALGIDAGGRDGRFVIGVTGAQSMRIAARLHTAYDPDGDGDDDAAQACGHMQSAIGHLNDAIECLMPPEDKENRVRAAATEAEWVVGGAEDLPIDDKTSWDGPAAAERMLDAAGFNGNSPDPAKARRGFLVYDHHNPKLKGSYKFPFADLIGGELKAVKGGLHAAASRLPDSDLPDAVKTRARAVIDKYEKRMNGDDGQARARTDTRLRLARLAEAEAA